MDVVIPYCELCETNLDRQGKFKHLLLCHSGELMRLRCVLLFHKEFQLWETNLDGQVKFKHLLLGHYGGLLRPRCMSSFPWEDELCATSPERPH